MVHAILTNGMVQTSTVRSLKDQFRLDAATKADPKLTLADSLQQRITEQNMAVNMFFAPYYMRNIDAKDSAQLNNYVQHADSLISTSRYSVLQCCC